MLMMIFLVPQMETEEQVNNKCATYQLFFKYKHRFPPVRKFFDLNGYGNTLEVTKW